MCRAQTCAVNDASVESVFGQIKEELVRRYLFRTRQEATEKIDHDFLNLYNSWGQILLVKTNPNRSTNVIWESRVRFVDQTATRKPYQNAVPWQWK